MTLLMGGLAPHIHYRLPVGSSICSRLLLMICMTRHTKKGRLPAIDLEITLNTLN